MSLNDIILARRLQIGVDCSARYHCIDFVARHIWNEHFHTTRVVICQGRNGISFAGDSTRSCTLLRKASNGSENQDAKSATQN